MIQKIEADFLEIWHQTLGIVQTNCYLVMDKNTKDAVLATRRKGNITYYELSMPWSELIMDGVKLKADDAVRFNMIVNDNDGIERWGWLEYSAGIGTEKDGSIFGYLNLIDNR